MATDTDMHAVRALAARLAHLAPNNAAADAWHTIMLAAQGTGRTTARAWFEARNGQNVRTLQANINADGTPTSSWTPGARTVSATRAGSVQLDGSTRDYAGLRVAMHSESTLVCVAGFGNGSQVIIYAA